MKKTGIASINGALLKIKRNNAVLAVLPDLFPQIVPAIVTIEQTATLGTYAVRGSRVRSVDEVVLVGCRSCQQIVTNAGNDSAFFHISADLPPDTYPVRLRIANAYIDALSNQGQIVLTKSSPLPSIPVPPTTKEGSQSKAETLNLQKPIIEFKTQPFNMILRSEDKKSATKPNSVF